MSSMVPADLFENLEAKQPAITVQLQYLQSRVATLETQLEQAIAYAVKKEAYANTLAADLEHIIIQLKRLEIVKQGGASV